MAIIAKNTTGSSKNWGGITVNASSQYTLQQMDINKFLIDAVWQSDLQSGHCVINDGTQDLNAVNAVLFMKGFLPATIQGATTGTPIGNTGDALKTVLAANPDVIIGSVQLATNNLDSFGRLKVSNPTTVYDSSFQFNKLPLQWAEKVVSGGSVTHNGNTSSVDMAVTTTNGSTAIMQTKRCFLYHPGKANDVMMTGSFIEAKAGVTKRIGQYDSNNGYFFELNGSTLYVGLRSKVSGSIVDTKVAQNSWNMDKLDGTGASGVTLDITKQQIFFIDYQWLGSGRIRFGFIINGNLVICHQMLHSNILSTPYSQSADLPLRAEIISNGSNASSMRLTCCTLITEGEVHPDGSIRTINNGSTSRSFGTTGSKIPIISIRKQTAYANKIVKLQDFGVFANSADDFLVTLVQNGTLTGASWSDIDWFCQKDVSATAISGGTELYSCYLRGSSTTASESLVHIFEYANNIDIGHDIDDVSDIISVVAINLTSSANASAFINYWEIL